MTQRWFVEVSPLGDDNLTQKYCVEAGQWQTALKAARKLRGEQGPISRFAIELADEGYRATDQTMRVRYEVNRAPADAPLSSADAAPVEPVIPESPSPPESQPTAPSEPVIPESSVPEAKAAAGAADGPAAVPAPVLSPAPVVLAAEAQSPEVTPSGSAAAPVPAAPAAVIVERPAPGPSAAVPAAGPAAAVATPPSAGAVRAPLAVPSTDRPRPSLEVIHEREQRPSEGSPILYREQALYIAEGHSQPLLEKLMRERLSAMRDDVASVQAPKFIQLAIFDHRFMGRPERPPLATLAWKDWRGDPELVIRGKIIPHRRSSAPPPPSQRPLAGASSGADVPAMPAPARVPAEAAVLSAPAPAASPADRRRHGKDEDLIGDLFEQMHQLHFMTDIAAGAEYVLSAIWAMLPCEVVIVHVFDINAREFVVVRAAGAGAEKLVLERLSDQDPLFTEALRRTTSTHIPHAHADERYRGGRFDRLGVSVRSALFGPVAHGGRYLGAIELVNPVGGEGSFYPSEINALDYICEQFADFVAERPIVLDPEDILPRP